MLVVYTTTTTVRPIPYRSDRSTRTLVSFDAVLHLTAVMLTGNWNSPFAYTLLPSTLLAGFAAGPLSALELMGACAGVISPAGTATEEGIRSGGARAAAWAGVLASSRSRVGWLAGLGRIRATAAGGRGEGGLLEANALLFSSCSVAQSLPDSLTLDEVLDTTVARRSLIDADAAVTVLLYSEADRSWDAVRTKGYRSYSLRRRGIAPRTS
ncbi:MAG: hypothetical protein R2705_25145 [Ilumatobacteraceae bacterium]